MKLLLTLAGITLIFLVAFIVIVPLITGVVDFEVRNLSGRALTDVQIVAGLRLCSFGRIDPGQSVRCKEKVHGEGEISVSYLSAGARASANTAVYVNYNLGWRGGVMTVNSDGGVSTEYGP